MTGLTGLTTFFFKISIEMGYMVARHHHIG
jgi:hypothetical protein